MVEAIIFTLGSVILVSLLSLIGIFLISIKEAKLKKLLIYLVSFSAGALLGDALIHLLPEAAEEGFALMISSFVLFGVVVFFIMEKFIHWHHCHSTTHTGHPKSLAYMNLLGDAVHNFIDGLIIAASYIVSIPIGVATTIAVIFHEIPQEISDFGVLLHGGLSKKRALILNFLSAVVSIVGAVVGLLIFSEALLLPVLAFAAGGFIYIAGADLIPELHKKPEAKTSALQLIAFLLGLAVMYGILFLE